MTATLNRKAITRAGGDQIIPPHGFGALKADEVCKRGWLMAFDSNGYIVVVTTTTGLKSAGLAAEDADATGLSSGDITIDLIEGVVDVECADTLDDGDIGTVLYGSDNQTVTTTSTGASAMGLFWGMNADTGKHRMLVGRLASVLIAALAS